ARFTWSHYVRRRLALLLRFQRRIRTRPGNSAALQEPAGKLEHTSVVPPTWGFKRNGEPMRLHYGPANGAEAGSYPPGINHHRRPPHRGPEDQVPRCRPRPCLRTWTRRPASKAGILTGPKSSAVTAGFYACVDA